MSLSALMLTASLAHAIDTNDPFLLGQADASAEQLQFEPVLVGCAASACLGAPGCVGAGLFYYLTDPPPPQSPLVHDPAYQAGYAKEMQRRRARWAVLGGAAGAVTITAATVGLYAIVIGGTYYYY
ncbi:MAG: hypothetical protein H6741_19205 [Alphaproteobacteria bacterium]|nr:hypothetical protein [Alphaproteobacteria bacterium]